MMTQFWHEFPTVLKLQATESKISHFPTLFVVCDILSAKNDH